MCGYVRDVVFGEMCGYVRDVVVGDVWLCEGCGGRRDEWLCEECEVWLGKGCGCVRELKFLDLRDNFRKTYSNENCLLCKKYIGRTENLF